MSIRIQNDGLAGTAAAAGSRTDATGLGTGGKTGVGRGAGLGGDRVEISSLSETLANAGSAADSQRSSQVARLTSLFASGQYKVNSAQVSSALVSQALIDTGSESTS